MQTARRFFSSPAKLPDLPYDYNALEPVISADIMKLHHLKHHQTYVTNLNSCLSKLEDARAKNDIQTQISLVPALKFNGGGHINHSIFWKNLCPAKSFRSLDSISSPFTETVKTQFRSTDALQNQLSAVALAIQGSGWAWLGYSKDLQRLVIATTANQDPLEATQNIVPVLGIDVWEHAYYLQYKNARADYLKAIWQVINWKDVIENYTKLATNH